MDDALLIICELLLSQPTAPQLLAFVKLQATRRAVYLRYRHDTELWRKLLTQHVPRWSLPEHMGVRRRAILSIRMLDPRCLVCGGHASRLYFAFQGRLCLRCSRRVLVPEHACCGGAKLPYTVRYIGGVRVRYFMLHHLRS